jgi:hypothetical protein
MQLAAQKREEIEKINARLCSVKTSGPAQSATVPSIQVVAGIHGGKELNKIFAL